MGAIAWSHALSGLEAYATTKGAATGLSTSVLIGSPADEGARRIVVAMDADKALDVRLLLRL